MPLGRRVAGHVEEPIGSGLDVDGGCVEHGHAGLRLAKEQGKLRAPEDHASMSWGSFNRSMTWTGPVRIAAKNPPSLVGRVTNDSQVGDAGAGERTAIRLRSAALAAEDALRDREFADVVQAGRALDLCDLLGRHPESQRDAFGELCDFGGVLAEGRSAISWMSTSVVWRGALKRDDDLWAYMR